jgi:acetyl-CoA acyltransferase 2
MLNNHKKEVVFLSGKRTAMGTFGGSLRQFTATELGTFAARAALDASGVKPEDVGHVVIGNALQTSSDSIYLARHIGLKAGVPVETPALALNRLCGSGFQAIVTGAEQIMLGDSEVALCGGAESMSQAPHVVRGARWGDLRLGPPGDYFEDLLWTALTDTHCGLSMAQTAEKLAEQYGITRAQADDVAYNSQQRAKAAWDAGHFNEEIVGIPIKSKKGEVEFRSDEHMRPETTREALAGLRPYFKKDGLVTAGNASGIGDGAAAVVISSADWARERGLKPIGCLVSWGIAGVDPSIMGIGPAPAARKALERAGMTIDQMDLVEVNEAFAPQFCAVAKELELDPAKTNVSGGAIAMTHPLGASGARITVHLLHELKRRGARYGLGSACIGGGQGIAVIVESM